MKDPSASEIQMMERAIEVFVKGFAYTRSFTFPCSAEPAGKMWVIRDALRRRAADYRREEWVAHALPPQDADAAARRGARSPFCLSMILPPGESDVAMREAFRKMKYRLLCTEPLMVHHMKIMPRVPMPVPVVRVDSQQLADAVKKSARRKQALPEHFGKNAALRLYAAMDGSRAVGWVRSIPAGNAAWVSNMFVLPQHRRQGIGKSLLAAMLADDRRHGIRQSVLLSSHTGALLYPHVGYEQIGMLYLYMPAKK